MLRNIFWYSYRILVDAVSHYWRDNGSAFASHVALSGLLAFFPFFIFGTSLASFLGAFTYTPQKIKALVQLLPDVIAEPLSQEIINVLTIQRGGVLTVSVIGAAYFASNGVEALRTALNRAYRVVDRRSLLFCRFQSLFFVILGAVGLIVISVLLILTPLLIKIMQNHPFFITEYIGVIRLWRYIIAAVVLFVSLLIVHKWLPAERRKFIDILPGIVLTMFVWFMASIAFAQYLTMFDYISTYAGLASIMVAIIFLYILSAIFILGGEINAAIMFHRKHLQHSDEYERT
ncbi:MULTISPECIES: YihY/virulence factor BrkB family protein [Bartonella]|uniref:YihY family inner membrane protein n=2 Tax=Bartonella grahamii TaxID=33045 RepID=A0A336NDQ7_BARGR|nr:YihY/virulence factor BrkB family protein [Bartonella grahamii]ACS52069.1 ribonuclease RNAse BN transmembrane protein [Bartonella grahamii as4aup]SSZ39673.1 YihY family inner membrane protein [Bartonella grahamii]